MAHLLKPTYTKVNPETGRREQRRTRKWYAQFTDAAGATKRVPLCEDKSAAQAMLVELLRRVERVRAGLIDTVEQNSSQSVEDQVSAYESHLVGKGRSEKHVAETVRIIRNITSACRLEFLADLQMGSDRVEAHLRNRLKAGSSHRTVNADLVAIRSFCRWLLNRKRIRLDPTLGLERRNEDEDRRRERRSLTESESRALIESTAKSGRIFRGLPGFARSVLYLLAQRSGLRRGELKSLTPRSFKLDNDPPTVTVMAEHPKRRKADELPLTSETVDALRIFLAGRSPNEPLWPGSWWRRAAEMIAADLAEANIEVVDKEGRVLDFHGQRVTFITELARADVHPATAQRLARHSDINLTLGTYTKLNLQDLVDAIASLPRLTDANEAKATELHGFCPSQIDLDVTLQSVIAMWPHLSYQIRIAIHTLVSLGTSRSNSQ